MAVALLVPQLDDSRQWGRSPKKMVVFLRMPVHFLYFNIYFARTGGTTAARWLLASVLFAPPCLVEHHPEKNYYGMSYSQGMRGKSFLHYSSQHLSEARVA